jgi:hypothetical protein
MFPILKLIRTLNLFIIQHIFDIEVISDIEESNEEPSLLRRQLCGGL